METLLQIINSFLGAIILGLSLVLIPEIKKSKKYRRIIWILTVILIAIGVSIILIDRSKNIIADQLQTENLETIKSLDKTILDLKNSRKEDSILNEKFKTELFSKFHIKDSANIPVLNIEDNHGKMTINL